MKGKYVCPRCNILYCSLPCYQSEVHVNCSEAFYQDCVMEDLKSQDTDPVAERKMAEIFKRLQQTEDDDENNLDSDDDDSMPDLHERMRNVNLDDADSVWEKLTPAERQEFEEMLQSGDASELVAPWEPWWLYRKKKVLVEEMETEYPDYRVNCPKIKNNVPSFHQISKTAPSPCVKFNILNLIGAYCYTSRFFNGEHHSMPAEACSTFVSLSGNLSLNHTYDSAVIAVEAVAHEAVNCTWISGSNESVNCMKEDVQCILTGPEDINCTFYLLAALSDMYQLMTEAKRSKCSDADAVKKTGEFSKKFSDQSSVSLVQKDKLKLYTKKLEYYLSWSQAFGSEICCLTLHI
ncbi:zinc finger HIT domain-containing protein 2 isoform X2 [Periplaneta americana]